MEIETQAPGRRAIRMTAAPIAFMAGVASLARSLSIELIPPAGSGSTRLPPGPIQTPLYDKLGMDMSRYCSRKLRHYARAAMSLISGEPDMT